jgi:hypothetical protein
VLPQFGELVDILSDADNGELFILKLSETLCFNEHYHAYEIAEMDDTVIADLTELLDHHPLLKHNCGSNGELTVICAQV